MPPSEPADGLFPPPAPTGQPGDACSDRRAMRLIFLAGPLAGLLLLGAELLSLAHVHAWLGEAVVAKRLHWHLWLRLYRHLAECVLLGGALAGIAVWLARRRARAVSTLDVIAAPPLVGLVAFHGAFGLPGRWGVVPPTPLWLWAVVAAGAFAVIVGRSRPTAEPLTPLRRVWWRAYLDRNDRPLGIALFATVLATYALYFAPWDWMVVAWGSLVVLALLPLPIAAAVHFRGGRARQGVGVIGVLVFMIPVLLAAAGWTFMGAMMGPMPYWGQTATIIRMAQDSGGLADLPADARNLDGTVTGGSFTLPVYLRFQADGAEIERWIAASPGLKPDEEIPLWMQETILWEGREFGPAPRVFGAHGGGVGGRVVVNDQTHTVFIHVSWS